MITIMIEVCSIMETVIEYVIAPVVAYFCVSRVRDVKKENLEGQKREY